MSDDSRRVADLSPAQRRLLEQRLAAAAQVAEPIAIVGMSCRFPGSPNLHAYWRVILDGVDTSAEIPSSRWNIDELYDPTGEQPGKMSIRRAAMVSDVDRFDASFFGIAPREASRMDPQQRLLLEVAWEAFEVAGWSPDRMCGTATGVFVGIGGQDYSRIPAQYDDYFRYIDAYGGTGTALSIAANRVSYALDLRGPSVAVDTACSSSSVAIHWAIQSLRSRECDAALAGGVNLILSPETTIAFSKAHMLSPDGRCRPFDAGANGYVRGEGCAVLVLKRLTDAVRDRDTVFAVIRASAVNQDGRTSGITAPNAQSQQSVIRSALLQAGWPSSRVDYIEAHGTATPLGDPIEMESLARVYRRERDDESTCYVTSVKANIGHTETVSGVAGIIKVALMMRHGMIPGQLHFQSLNPHIALDGTRLAVPAKAIEWLRNGRPRTAGVSSFGFGGTNSHLLLEESTSPPVETRQERPHHVLTLSGKTADALARQVQSYRDYLSENPDANIGDVCFTANSGRTHFQHRLAVVAKDAIDLQRKLSEIAQSQQSNLVWTGQPKSAKSVRIAFLFTGQGSQYAGMGRALYDSHALYRKIIDECDEILRPILDRPLISVMFPENMADGAIDETAYTQPALFAHEYALARLWRSWGIVPDIVMGHSVGEYVAACVAGSFTLEHGLTLIAHRARLMQSLPRDGRMVVAFADAASIQQFIDSHSNEVAVAALNGPENTVISGRDRVVAQIVSRLESQGIQTQSLRTSHSFHSPLMDPMLDEFERLAAECEFRPNSIPLISNVTGSPIEDEWIGPEYWRRHVRQPVRFAESVAALEAADVDVVIEIGPAPTLIGMARRCAPTWRPAWLPSLRRDRDNWLTLLGSLAEMYALGVKVDWTGFDSDWSRRKLVLPTYPFERTRHWFEPKTLQRGASVGSRGQAVHPLLGAPVPAAIDSTLFESRISSQTPGYLIDHQVQGSAVLPAAAYIEQALSAANEVFGEGPHSVKDLTIREALFLPAGETRLVQLSLAPESRGERAFEVFSMTADATADVRWTLHASGRIRHGNLATDLTPMPIDLDAVQTECDPPTERADFYQQMSARGLSYGPQFQTIVNIRRAKVMALAEFHLVSKTAIGDRLHVTLGDAVMQSLAGVIPLENDGSHSPYTYLPAGVRSVQVWRAGVDAGFICVRRKYCSEGPSPEDVEADASLLDSSGNEFARFEGIRLQRVGRPAGERSDDVRDWLYRVDWVKEANESVATLATSDYVIFADQIGVGRELADSIASPEVECRVVVPGAEYSECLTPDRNGVECRIDPLDESHYERVLESGRGDRNLTIVHLWSLDTPPIDRSDDGSKQWHSCDSALLLIRQFARRATSSVQRLMLVTRGVHSIGPGADRVAVEQSPIWGLGRVAAGEHPELRVSLIDLDAAASARQSAESLRREVTSQSEPEQTAFRDGERYVARLARSPKAIGDDCISELASAGGEPFRVRLVKPGNFDELRLEKLARHTPGAGQVEIEVRAAGVNFSDVLKVMGLYPGITDAVVPLGIEASGVVKAIGEGVTRFRVGDEVLGVAPFSFASHTITAEYAIVGKPASISHAEAATIPITFLTAHYALVTLGRLRRGERVLIHAGAGGVGLAAIQIAQHVGAEIFATAGSDDKREFLRGLGIEHVFDTRSLDFAERILNVTHRQGVDVVLNSLPGDAINKSLSILRAYGRFLEIGKIDIYQNRSIGLLPFQDNLSYFAIDLDRMLRQRPDDIRALFCEVMDHFAAGHYRPLPFTDFPARHVSGALRFMSQRKNTGKVVVSIDTVATTDSRTDSPRIRADGTYLITGGLGALGLQTAQWLAAQGSRNIAILSRRQPRDDAATQIESMRRAGVQIAVLTADVADRESLKAALASITVCWPPLRGIFHAAGVLDDGILFDMTMQRWARVLAPKVQGAWNLHELTLDQPLDCFVLFSSVASILGSPGQGNYAAGNAFLDAMADFRRQRGLPVLSVNWGPWAGGGMAASGDHAHQLKSRGFAALDPARAFEVLHRLIVANATRAVVADIRWNELSRLLAGRTPTILKQMEKSEVQRDAITPASGVDLAFRQLLAGASPEERRTMLRQQLSEQLGRIMGIDAAQIDVDQPLNSLGLDSLMAMELKSVIESKLGFSLPMARFFTGPSVSSLAEDAAELLAGAGESHPRHSAHSWSPVVLLEPGGPRAPVFCVHPIGGDVRCYFEFARHVGGDRAIYALAARGLAPSQDPHASMSEMIADYATAVDAIERSGPLHMIGWSTGGIYAVALADELVRRGREIGLLALLDCPHPALLPKSDLSDEARFLCDYVEICNHVLGAKMEVDYEHLKLLDPRSALEAVLVEAKKHQMVPSDASIEFVRRFIEVGRSTAMLLQEFLPPPLDVPVHHFIPENADTLSDLAGRELPMDRGWGDAAILHRAPGDHFSMLTSANAAALAEDIRQLLNSSLQDAPAALGVAR